jgi:thiamine kinase-like enzyme
LRLYAYAALGGYLWALWTQYKQSFGVEFGEYGIKMYRYAKDYYGYITKLNEEYTK